MKLRHHAACALVALALFHLGWVQLHPGSEARHAWGVARRAHVSDDWEMCSWCDPIALGARIGDGNVFLRFEGYTNGVAADEYVASLFYFRGNYALFPQRLEAVPENRIVNGGSGILREPFTPDAAWFRQHHVESVLTLGKDHAGRTTSKIEPVATWHPSSGVGRTVTGGHS